MNILNMILLIQIDDFLVDTLILAVVSFFFSDYKNVTIFRNYRTF